MENVHRVYFNTSRVLLGDIAIPHQRHSLVVFYASLMLGFQQTPASPGGAESKDSVFLAFCPELSSVRPAEMYLVRPCNEP